MKIPNSILAIRGSNFVLWSGTRGDVFVRPDGILAQMGEETYCVHGDQFILQVLLNAIA